MVGFMINRRNAILFILCLDALFTLAATGLWDIFVNFISGIFEFNKSIDWLCDNWVTPRESAFGISVSVIVCFILCRYVIKNQAPRIRFNAVSLFLTLWFAFLIIGAFAGGHTIFSLVRTKIYLLYAICYFVFLFLNEDSWDSLEVLHLFAFLYSLISILQFFGVDILPGQSRYVLSKSGALHAYSLFGNSHLLADFLAPVMPAGISLLINAKSKKKKLYFFMSLAVIIFSIFITGSRAAFMSAFIGSFLIIIINFPKNYVRFKRIAILFTLILSVLVLVSYTGRIQAKKDSVELRLLYWKASIKMIEENPWTGGGADHFKLKYFDYQGELLKEADSPYLNWLVTREKPGHPHNEYLNFLVECGIPGLLFFSLSILLSLINGFKASSKGNILAGTWFCVLLGICIEAFFGYPLRVPTTGIILFLSLSTLSRLSNQTPWESVAKSLNISKVTKPVILILLILLTIVSIVFHYDFLRSRILLSNARVALSQSNPQKAYMLASESIELNPYDGEAYFTSGVSNFKMGYPIKALEDFYRARNISADPNLEYNISLADYDTGETVRAISIMERLEKAIPGDIRPKQMLMKYYTENGDVEKADFMRIDALSLARYYASIHLDINDLFIAEKWIRIILSLDSNDVEGNFYLEELNRRKNNGVIDR